MALLEVYVLWNLVSYVNDAVLWSWCEFLLLAEHLKHSVFQRVKNSCKKFGCPCFFCGASR